MQTVILNNPGPDARLAEERIVAQPNYLIHGDVVLLYQGMTSVVPITLLKDEGFSPCAFSQSRQS
ncbi:MAG: hypothetical protein WBW84_18515, partial [Acidobacteriaceae bacterium]